MLFISIFVVFYSQLTFSIIPDNSCYRVVVEKGNEILYKKESEKNLGSKTARGYREHRI